MSSSRPSTGPTTLVRPGLRAAALLAALVAVAGCSAAEDAATGARDAAVASASAAASQAVADAIEGQICGLVGDGQVSPADLDELRQAVDQAGTVGVPAEVLDPARELIAQGDQAGQTASQSLTDLQERCAGR